MWTKLQTLNLQTHEINCLEVESRTAVNHHKAWEMYPYKYLLTICNTWGYPGCELNTLHSIECQKQQSKNLLQRLPIQYWGKKKRGGDTKINEYLWMVNSTSRVGLSAAYIGIKPLDLSKSRTQMKDQRERIPGYKSWGGNFKYSLKNKPKSVHRSLTRR